MEVEPFALGGILDRGERLVKFRSMDGRRRETPIHVQDLEEGDGNIERPTLKPSIWLRDRKGWHGYITEGNLVTA